MIDYLGFLTTAAEQWTVDSGQWSVVSCQRANHEPRTMNLLQTPLLDRRGGSRCILSGDGVVDLTNQWTVDSGQWSVVSCHPPNSALHTPHSALDKLRIPHSTNSPFCTRQTPCRLAFYCYFAILTGHSKTRGFTRRSPERFRGDRFGLGQLHLRPHSS